MPFEPRDAERRIHTLEKQVREMRAALQQVPLKSSSGGTASKVAGFPVVLIGSVTGTSSTTATAEDYPDQDPPFTVFGTEAAISDNLVAPAGAHAYVVKSVGGRLDIVNVRCSDLQQLSEP